MGAPLVKSRTVVRFPTENNELIINGLVPFVREKDEPDEREFRVVVDRELWADLGEPEFLTVTIEPGDLLNVES